MPKHETPVVILGGDATPTPEDFLRVASGEAQVALAPAAWARVDASRAVVLGAVERGESVYGVTTGVGSQKTATVSAEAIASFNRRLLVAHGTVSTDGTIQEDAARAALAIQIHIFARGHCGVSRELVQALVARLNGPGPMPAAEGNVSVGASDLVPLAQLALPLLGIALPEDEAPAAALPALGAKEALSLMNSNAVSLGRALLNFHDLSVLARAQDLAFALALEGFRAQLASVDPALAAHRPVPGTARLLQRLDGWLEGSTLREPGAARFLQDPLSFRCAPAIHGASAEALAWLGTALAQSFATTPDNPVVDAMGGRLLSHGNMDTTLECLALDASRAAAAAVMNASMQRIHKLHWPTFSGLPTGLGTDGDAASGVQFLNLAHIAEAHAMEARSAAAPTLGLYQAQLADGVEDYAAPLPLSVAHTERFVEAAFLVAAVEAAIAAWAISRRGVSETSVGQGLRPLFRLIHAELPVGREGHAVFDLRPMVAILREHATAEIAQDGSNG